MRNQKRIDSILQGLLIAALFAAAWPIPAFAEDLAAVVDRLVGTEFRNVPDVISAVYYIGGAAFCGAGLLKLKLHADNPTQNKLGEGVGRLSVGAGLLALPYVSNALIHTFNFGQTAAPYNSFNQVT